MNFLVILVLVCLLGVSFTYADSDESGDSAENESSSGGDSSSNILSTNPFSALASAASTIWSYIQSAALLVALPIALLNILLSGGNVH